MSTTPEMILVRTEGRVGVITLNRPKALNALNEQLMNEILWKYVKGERAKLPTLKQAPWVKAMDID